MQLLGPVNTQGGYDHLTYGELRDLRRESGDARKESKVVMKTRVSTMDGVKRKRSRDMADAIDPSEDLPVIQKKKRCGADDFRLASVTDKEIVKERAHWWKGAHWDVNHASPEDGVEAGMCAWSADVRNEASGQDLSAEEEKLHKRLLSAAEGRGLTLWEKREVF